MTRRSIQTEAAPAAIGTYSQAIRVGDTVYLSGQIGLDPITMQMVEERLSIIEEGTSKKFVQGTVEHITFSGEYALKKGHRDKYKKRMTRGSIWTVLGVIITCATFAFADL